MSRATKSQYEPVQVSHDPFGRYSIIRKVVEPYRNDTCEWCGQLRKGGNLFRYGTESDSIGGGTSWDSELFCSISCRRSYWE